MDENSTREELLAELNKPFNPDNWEDRQRRGRVQALLAAKAGEKPAVKK